LQLARREQPTPRAGISQCVSTRTRTLTKVRVITSATLGLLNEDLQRCR
jgi:hypothetical protein